MADPVTALAVVATVGAAGQAVGQTSAADAEKDAIRLRAKQDALRYQQESLSNFDLIEKTLARQTAEATTRGVALSSPSLLAIQRRTIDTGFKQQKNLDIEKSFAERNRAIEKKNVNNKLFAQLFGDATSLASSFASLSGSVPTTKG